MSSENSDRQLTELQFILVVEVLKFSLAKGYSATFELAGSSERFIRCQVGPVSAYLYSDGFDLQGDGLDVRFEPDDIRTPSDAIMSLGESLKQALTF